MAAKKISTAIGVEVAEFVVTEQASAEAPTGYKGTQYTVETNSGQRYKCEILEPSRLGKIVTWGMGKGAAATCTEFAATTKGKPSQTAATASPHKAKMRPVEVATAAASVVVSDKAAKKISKAIGEEIEDFVVTRQEQAEAPTGYKGTEYTVETSGGKRYKCEILEPSKLGKIATWGMGKGADATCTDFTRGSSDKGKTKQTNCDALSRSAGKCN
jgi:hypothetical protein